MVHYEPNFANLSMLYVAMDLHHEIEASLENVQYWQKRPERIMRPGAGGAW